jgi:hypothetical protein
MADNRPFYPDIPERLRTAARAGKLVPFIGAGVSQLAGCPGWDEFSTEALGFFVKQGKLRHGLFAQLCQLPSRVKLGLLLRTKDGWHVDEAGVIPALDSYCWQQ